MKANLSELQALQPKLEARIAGKPGVLGVGIGANRARTNLAFHVYCADRITADALPHEVEGIEIVPDIVGTISAY